MTHKQKIILAIGLLLFVLFGLYSSCHQAVATNAGAHANNPVFPASPQSIESERGQAQRELDEAQRQAEAAKAPSAKRAHHAARDAGADGKYRRATDRSRDTILGAGAD